MAIYQQRGYLEQNYSSRFVFILKFAAPLNQTNIMKLIILTLLTICTCPFIFSQSVGIAEKEFTPHNSAALEIKSTTKGLLIPRLSKEQREAISNPAQGLIVYQTEGITGFYYFDGDSWYNLNDSKNDLDTDPSNELQTIQLSGNELTLSDGGSVILSGVSAENQTLALKGDTLLISNGNYVLLEVIKDNLGNHQAEENIQTLGHFISADGDNEGVFIHPKGDVTFSNDIAIAGSVSTTNLNASGAVNLTNNAIQTAEIENNAVTTAKIGNSQITGEKIHPMGASTDQYLRFDGKKWGPADMPGGLNYLGTWNAYDNIPLLANPLGTNSDYYVVSVAGKQNLGSGIISFNIGDWIIYNGDAWEKISNSNDVNSVFGRTGTIVAQYGDYTWANIDKTLSDISDISNINASTATAGQLLMYNGTQWINNSVSGDISLNSSGNAQINPGAILYNDLSEPTHGANSIIVWDGSSWADETFQSLESDGSATNEIQDLSLSGNILTLSQDPSGVDLTPFLDNTDAQSLSFTSPNLSISGGNSVDLSALAGTGTDDQNLTLQTNILSIEDGNSVSLAAYLDNTDAQSLSFTSPNLSISGGNSVDLSALAGTGTDDQELTLLTNTLSIEDGNSVSLASFMDNTDNQDLTLTANTLSLTNDATTVDLAPYLDNTDNQRLSIASNNLSIEDGNSVSLAPYLDNTDAQSLSFTSPNLSISGGNSVDLSALATGADDQVLSLESNKLSIEDGNSVNLAPFLDNTDEQLLTFNNPNLSISGGNTVNLSALASASDKRLKENIIGTKFGIKDVLKLNVYDYDFISGPSNQTGLIAQDLYKVYPSAVKVGGENVKENPWGIRYNMLTPLLTKAVQDLYYQVKELEKVNQELTNKNKIIQEELTKVKSHEQRILELEQKLELLLENSK